MPEWQPVLIASETDTRAALHRAVTALEGAAKALELYAEGSDPFYDQRCANLRSTIAYLRQFTEGL